MREPAQVAALKALELVHEILPARRAAQNVSCAPAETR
jgi:hypothetical protein